MTTNQNSEIEIQKSPFDLLPPYQLAWIKDDSRFKIGVWSRQTGKSFCTAGEAVVDCLTHSGVTWICLSAGERQSLEWLEKAKHWIAAFEMSFDQNEERPTPEALLKSAEIRFSNGSRIIAIPGNPNTARGYAGSIILDEFAYHENPDAIWAAMFPSLASPFGGTFIPRAEALFKGQDFTAIQRQLKIRIVSTFNGQNNKFFSLWERRQENGYSGHFIDIYKAAEEVRQHDGTKVDIEKLRGALDDPEAWSQEFECIPADISSVLLPYELLASCESLEATTTVPLDYFTSLATRHSTPYVIGIDFGRKRNLTVAWTDEIMGDVLHCREVLELRDTPTPDQVAHLSPRIRNARRVCLDYTGPGVGLGDELVKQFGQYNPDKHEYGKIELCTFSNPFKVELFSKLRMSLEQRRCRIPINRVIREDLHSVQRVTTINGTITYRAPHTGDGHADRCTAKALAQRASTLSVYSTPCKPKIPRWNVLHSIPLGIMPGPNETKAEAEARWLAERASNHGRIFF